MPDQTFTSGQILTASQMSTLQSNTGLVAMTPSSVSGTGVTLSGNTMVVTAASTASIIGVFTSAFTNYVTVFNITATSDYLRMKLRTASADISTGYGNTQAFVNDNSTSVSFLNSGAASWNDTRWLIAANQQAYGEITLYNPQKAVSTFYTSDVASITSTNSSKLFGSGRNTGTDVCTGLTIFPDSGTFTGTVTVYGYRL